MFKAEIVADSITESELRLTTFVITLPRIILAEFNTHRAFSRNSASSRAIPFKKMVEAVKNTPFIPIAWQKDHSGMQGTEYFEGPKDNEELTAWWLGARDKAVEFASTLNQIGVTKQLCNRLLEPFMWHTIIVTASQQGYENFFSLRANDMAEIHIQKIAYMMLEEYNKSTPKILKIDEWHIPFGDNMNEAELQTIAKELNESQISSIKAKIATARCARVSYTLVGEENKPFDLKKDIALHDNLLASGHMSPFEHCAFVSTNNLHTYYSGNFNSLYWRQYRKTLADECRLDSRVLDKHS